MLEHTVFDNNEKEDLDSVLRVIKNTLGGQSYPEICEMEWDTARSLPQLLERLTTQESRRVILLEPLSFNILPQSTNILASILARIKQSLRDNPPLQGALVDDYCSFTDTDPLQSLRRLQTDMTLGFDGNMPERRGHCDPDTFIVETMRSEQSRLSVQPHFEETLAQIVEAFFEVPPLFVQVVVEPTTGTRNNMSYLRHFRSPYFLVLVTREF